MTSVTGGSAAAATQAPFGISVLAASHAEIADRFGRGALVEATSDDFEILEVSVPAEMGTESCDPPAGFKKR